MASTTLEQNERDRFASTRERFCRRCGYGIVVRREPPECPMCRSSAWRERPGPARWN